MTTAINNDGNAREKHAHFSENDPLLATTTTETIADNDYAGEHGVNANDSSISSSSSELGRPPIASVTYSRLSHAISDELHRAGEGNLHNYLLSTNLTRNSGIIPEDIATGFRTSSSTRSGLGRLSALAISPDELESLFENDETGGRKTDGEKAEIKHIPNSAYFLLASAIVALSFIGPMLKMQEGNAIMKIIWRLAATTFLFIPLAIWEVLTNSMHPTRDTVWYWICSVLAGVLYGPYCYTFAIALDYTSVQDSVILSNTQSLILLLGKLLVGSSASRNEILGAIVAFSGAVLCNRDSADNLSATSTTDSSDSGKQVLLGDALSLLSALAGVFYLVLSKLARSCVPLYPFMFVVMVSGTLVSVFTAQLMSIPVSWDMDEEYGVFGFFNIDRMDRLPLEFVTVIVCNVFGTMGYVRALMYFDPLVVATGTLMEPVVASILAALVGVDSMPGWKGWIGNALVAAGTFAVVYQPPDIRARTSSCAVQSTPFTIVGVRTSFGNAVQQPGRIMLQFLSPSSSCTSSKTASPAAKTTKTEVSAEGVSLSQFSSQQASLRVP